MKAEDIRKLMMASLEKDFSKADRQRLKQALEGNPELMAEYQAFEQLSDLLGKQEFQFESFFRAKIMRKLQEDSPKEALAFPLFTGMQYAFSRVTLPAMFLLLALLLSTWMAENSLSLDAVNGISELSVNDIMTELFVSL